jgi:hypothetical protein
MIRTCLICALLAAATGLCATLTVIGLVVVQNRAHISATMANLKDGSKSFAGAMKTGATLLDEISKDYYDPANPEAGLYWELRAQGETATMASRSMVDFIQDLHAGLLGGLDSHGAAQSGTVPAATSLLASFQGVTDRTAKYLDQLAGENSPLKPVAESLRNLAQITADLERQTRAGGNVDATLAAFAAAVERLDGLLAKPEVAAIIDNLEQTTKHANGTAANMDEATGYIRDMLKPSKESFWKQLAFKAVGAALPPVVTHLIPQHTVIVNTVKTETSTQK